MTEKHQDNLPVDDDRVFDLLTDDELDEGRRRELLSGLDDKPGGWRQCALAFLEAQSWKKEFGFEAETPQPQPAETEASETEPATLGLAKTARRRWQRSPGWVGTVLGMAASFLIAVGLTSLTRDMQRQGVGPGGSLVESAGLAGRDPAKEAQIVHLPGKSPGGKQYTVGVPAVPRDSLDEDWLQNAPTAVPANIAQAFEHAGHEVRSSRQLLPYRMKDGRRLMVPVDQLDVHYVNNPTYQ